ncbi:T6SS effector BTH_I2691 family protein [Pseudomonas urmiensis]|uniref:T6SS effector BTH_I2691 family protein n=2 Tax=Pseudomonas urmiensis TaxID=2745493 RepID=UPI003C951528
MSISQHIAHAIAESAMPPDQCLACERQGLPILPLRRALVPDTRPAYNAPVIGGKPVETRLGLRTLRMGYLYVLLDRKVWQAFEVTEHAHLRRFNPLEPPPAPPRPLPKRCVGKDHDIPSAFLTLDSKTYSSAWIAFSSDAWPPSVLNAYRDGKAPPERFQVLDLAQLRNAPAELGLAMTPDALKVDRQVFEYAEQLPGDFDSVHGFHSRFLRQTALRGYVLNAIAKHQLAHGVLALDLDDTVGMVQEFNHARLNWISTRQRWREEPLRAYQLQTSQLLLSIRAMHRQWAEQQTPAFDAQTGDGPPLFVDPAVERQRIVDYTAQNSDERLEQRYHEPMRAAFQAEYDRQEAQYQHYIYLNARFYASLCASPTFKRIEQYDYDGNDRESGIAYCKTMALCLAGGISEAPTANREAQPAAGSSAALWLKWLQDPHSPPYRALLLRDQSLLAALLPSFSITDPTEWNDSDKLYAALSKVIASDDAGLRLRTSLQQAISDAQGALNAASQRLHPLAGPGVQRAVMRLNCASQWLYNGVQLVELQVQMKLSEYYALQSAHLRQMQHTANAAMAQARERMQVSLEELQQQSQSSLRKVRPIIQNGLLSLAVLDPKLAHSVIAVSVWVQGTAEQVRDTLVNGTRASLVELNRAAQVTMLDLTVAVGTLEPNARQALQGLRVTSRQAAQLLGTSFTGLRGVAGSWELLLAMGGLYLLSDSLEKNMQKAEAEIGDKSMEAWLALQGSSLAILGGSVETVGLIVRQSALQVQKSAALAAAGASGASSGVAVGHSLVRVGAMISAVTGVLDAAQTSLAVKRTFAEGDTRAWLSYSLASGASAIGVSLSIFAIFHPVLYGPLGIAIILSISAYNLTKWAEQLESTPLERWAKRCYFGKANETPVIHWNRPEHADIAFAELNAATLGLLTHLEFKTLRADPTISSKIGGLASLATQRHIKFRIILPGFDETRSAYHWTLTVHRHGDGLSPDYTGGETIISGKLHPLPNPTTALRQASLQASQLPKFPDYKKDSIVVNKIRHQAGTAKSGYFYHEDLSGSIELNPDLGKHNILAATLSVIYWPDRAISDAYAEIVLERKNS